MKEKVLSQCSKMYQMNVLLCNDHSLKVPDGKCIEGKKKEACWLNIPDEKRLANNSDAYDLSVSSCARKTELQDVAYFLLQLAASAAIPITLEVRCCHAFISYVFSLLPYLYKSHLNFFLFHVSFHSYLIVARRWVGLGKDSAKSHHQVQAKVRQKTTSHMEIKSNLHLK